MPEPGFIRVNDGRGSNHPTNITNPIIRVNALLGQRRPGIKPPHRYHEPHKLYDNAGLPTTRARGIFHGFESSR